MLKAYFNTVREKHGKWSLAPLGFAALLALSAPVAAEEDKAPAQNWAELMSEQSLDASGADPQIVGGWMVRDGRWWRNFRWVVSLANSWGGGFCGGTLIDPEWVLTAAHCTANSSPEDIQIRTDTPVLSGGGRLTNVIGIIQHPDYNNSTLENDLALLRLETPLTHLPNISPATAAQAAVAARPGWLTNALGWGFTTDPAEDPDAVTSDRLRMVRVPIWPQRRCVNFYGDLGATVADSMMCAGLRRGGVDTCQGDSGGPLATRYQGDWVQTGITSWGIGCAQRRQPGVYTRVGDFETWIQQVIGGDFGCVNDDTPAPIRNLDFDCYSMPASDDGRLRAQIGFPINIGGTTVNEIWINTNGHLLIDCCPSYSDSSFRPEPLDAIAFPILAPFWMDLTTQGAGYNPVNYGQTTIAGRRAFVVTWQNAGFFGQAGATDLRRNSFQVILIETSVGSGDFEIEYNFGQLEFDTTNGGSVFARMGLVLVSADPDNIVEANGSGVGGSLIDGGPNALVSHTNAGWNGRYRFNVVGGVLN